MKSSDLASLERADHGPAPTQECLGHVPDKVDRHCCHQLSAGREPTLGAEARRQRLEQVGPVPSLRFDSGRGGQHRR
jgi:hypothetical protein